MIIRGDEPIFIIRRAAGPADEYGNPTFTETEILVRDCLFWVGSTSSPEEVARNPVDAELTVCFPAGTEILDGDEFEIRETRWEKSGIPQTWPELWPGFTPGVLVTVRKRRG